MSCSKQENTEKCSFEQKKRLANRIQKLTHVKDFIKIKKIIIEHNPGLEIVKNGNGLLMHFESLSNQTYVSIAQFFAEKDSAKESAKQSEENSVSEDIPSTPNFHTDEQLYSQLSNKHERDFYSMCDHITEPIKKIPKRLRFTNTETQLLNRAKYETALEKYTTENEVDTVTKTNDIFIQRVPPKSSPKKSTKSKKP